MSGLFFTSDTHFRHRNIIKYCSRPFKSIEEMDETLIDNWNKRIGPKDTVYHLGDFALGYSKDIFDRLNGHKYLIKGSHDPKETLCLSWYGVKDVWELKQGETRIWLAHHSHRVWPKSHYGAWHLFGHSHGTLPPHGLSFDIGVDGHGFCPWSIEEVERKIATLDASAVLKLSHH